MVSFSFSFPVPYNPFSANPASNGALQPVENGHIDAAPPRLSPGSSRGVKRGWEPSSSPQNPATPTFVSTSGILDRPSDYRELAASSPAEDFSLAQVRQDVSEVTSEPPAKRRRGIAGSIVSTAVSAAVIGSAVGLTVYRLWRDRGKEGPETLLSSSSQPPPPYQQGAWTTNGVEQPSVTFTPATPQTRGKKSRALHTRSPHVSAKRRKRPRGHEPGFSTYHSQQPVFPPAQPEFQFGALSPEDEDTQIDSLSSKLSYLIEQGKRALGTEIVVDSEAKEDEVDDGSGDWIDEDEPSSTRRRGRSGSDHARTAAPSSLPPSPRDTRFSFGGSQPMFIPGQRGFGYGGTGFRAPSSPLASSMPAPSHFRDQVNSYSPIGSVYAASNPSSSVREDPSTWTSDFMRESMEKARARARETRTGELRGG